MSSVRLEPLVIPRLVDVVPHELPPGHGHRCAYVGTIPHRQFHIRVSLDALHGREKPQLVVQIFPVFSNPNPENPVHSPSYSQMTGTFHQVTVPLSNPRECSVESFNRATLSRMKKTHGVALEGAARLGRVFTDKDTLLALFRVVGLTDSQGRGDDFQDIVRIAQRKLSLWTPKGAKPS